MAVEQVQASCQSSLALYSICFKCMFCAKELSPVKANGHIRQSEDEVGSMSRA